MIVIQINNFSNITGKYHIKPNNQYGQKNIFRDYTITVTTSGVKRMEKEARYGFTYEIYGGKQVINCELVTYDGIQQSMYLKAVPVRGFNDDNLPPINLPFKEDEINPNYIVWKLLDIYDYNVNIFENTDITKEVND